MQTVPNTQPNSVCPMNQPLQIPKTSKACRRALNGVFLLNKPLNISSNQALQYVIRYFAAQKAGHTGSLDVLATGMLPICFGEATKFSQYALDADKTYEVTACLGTKTDSGDAEGSIIAQVPVSQLPSHSDVIDVLKDFRGPIAQIPPMHSALKHQGQPLYRLARQGKKVERPSRNVTIYALDLLDYQPEQVSLRVTCSKGTYIRSLLMDIGDALGCGAYVTALHRTEVAGFQPSQMLDVETLDQHFQTEGLAGVDQHLLPIDSLLTQFQALRLTAEQARCIQQGRQFPFDSPAIPCLRLYDAQKIFLGLGQINTQGRLQPKRLLSNA